MSRKVRGCTLCDRLRKGDRTVKPSRNRRVHWTLVGDHNEWGQRRCQKFREAARSEETKA